MIAVVANAVRRIGKRVIKNRSMLAIAVGAFVAIFFFEVPFPLIVAAAGLIGLVGGRVRPDLFNIVTGHDEAEVIDDHDVLVGDQHIALGRPTVGRALRVAAIGVVLWFGPIAVIAALAGRGSVYLDVAWFFSTAAVLTFGGAYSVLAYISQEAVSTYGWLEPGEMIGKTDLDMPWATFEAGFFRTWAVTGVPGASPTSGLRANGAGSLSSAGSIEMTIGAPVRSTGNSRPSGAFWMKSSPG